MKLILLKRTAIGLILISLFSSSHSQTIVRKTYQTAFAHTAPDIDGMMNDTCANLFQFSGTST